MDDILKALENLNLDFSGFNILETIIVIFLSYALYRALSNVLWGKSKLKLNIGGRSKTYLRLVQSVLRYVFVILTTLFVLQINHIDVSSILAGVGIISAVIGVAAQDSLKDIIRGLTLISDKYFSVGDTIKYGDVEGKVIVIGLKTTKIKDIENENVISISNRNIEEAEVVAPCINLEIPLPYELPIDKSLAIMDEISAEAKNSELIEDCECQGANHFEDSFITYKLRVACNPEQKHAARRAAHYAVLKVLEKNHLSIPYPQLDLHQK